MTETQKINSLVEDGVGFSVQKVPQDRKRRKRKTPEWRGIKKIVQKNILRARQEKQIAELYWVKYKTAKEIAVEIFSDGGKIELVKSVLYRLRKLYNATSQD